MCVTNSKEKYYRFFNAASSRRQKSAKISKAISKYFLLNFPKNALSEIACLKKNHEYYADLINVNSIFTFIRQYCPPSTLAVIYF